MEENIVVMTQSNEDLSVESKLLHPPGAFGRQVGHKSGKNKINKSKD